MVKKQQKDDKAVLEVFSQILNRLEKIETELTDMNQFFTQIIESIYPNEWQ
jgi:hypothetical protein